MYGTPIWSSEIVGPDACVSGECGVYTLELGTNLITTDLNVKWYEHNILRQNSTSLSYLSDHMSSKTPGKVMKRPKRLAFLMLTLQEMVVRYEITISNTTRRPPIGASLTKCNLCHDDKVLLTQVDKLAPIRGNFGSSKISV